MVPVCDAGLASNDGSDLGPGWTHRVLAHFADAVDRSGFQVPVFTRNGPLWIEPKEPARRHCLCIYAFGSAAPECWWSCPPLQRERTGPERSDPRTGIQARVAVKEIRISAERSDGCSSPRSRYAGSSRRCRWAACSRQAPNARCCLHRSVPHDHWHRSGSARCGR